MDDMSDTLEHEAQQWLILLTSGRATAADAAALKLWCARSRAHAVAFAKANRLWDELGSVATRLPKPGSLAHANSNRPLGMGRRAFLGGGLAAAGVAIGYLVVRPPLDLWPSASEFTADYRTATGGRQQIKIANSISIDLNTRTSLNVRPSQKEDRFELVSGEAAIETAGRLARPLTIAALGGLVRATDAQFNLRCDAHRATVTCIHGSVEIEYFGKSATVGKGGQISYADGRLGLETTVDSASIMAWKTGQLIFRQTRLSEVVEEINRYRSGRIILMNEALGKRLVEARISLDQLDDLIELVHGAYDAKVMRLPGGVVLLS